MASFERLYAYMLRDPSAFVCLANCQWQFTEYSCWSSEGLPAGSTGSSIDILCQAFQANFALTKRHWFLKIHANKGNRRARHRFGLLAVLTWLVKLLSSVHSRAHLSQLFGALLYSNIEIDGSEHTRDYKTVSSIGILCKMLWLLDQARDESRSQ